MRTIANAVWFVIRTTANVIWFIFGGFLAGTACMLIGLFFCLTVVGIPVGMVFFRLGRLLYFPFGKAVVSKRYINKIRSK